MVAAGGIGPGLVGRRIALPGELLGRLLGGEVVAVSAVGEIGVSGARAGRTALLLPLVVNGRYFGVLAATAERTLRPDLRRALETLRTQVALALDGIALTAELTRQALHDSLTGLGNRALIGELHDSLTGLGNRALIGERLGQALARSRRSGRRVGALLLDLNGFKAVNDTLGHAAGDELLRAVAGRLTRCVRVEDTVGRLGGDEFVVVAEDLPDAAAAVRMAERIVAALGAPVVLGGRRVPASASVGVALSVDGSTVDELLRQADAAMYVAKRRPAGGVPRPHRAERAAGRLNGDGCR